MPRYSSIEAEPLAWQDLDGEIRAYLRDAGVPAADCGRLSHAVIRMCADAADSLARERLREHALDEAHTLLETWQASRREQQLARI